MLTFTANETETADGNAWADEHVKTCASARIYNDSKAAVAESPFSWCFTQTSLAIAVTVRCVCGATENVSDVASW